MMRAASVGLIILFCSFFGYAQSKRVIDWNGYTKSVAFADVSNDKVLEIVAFKVNGLEVFTGNSFEANGEWLKTFAVTIKNISGKRISSVRMHFGLPETAIDGKIGSGFSLEYGKDLSTGIDYGPQDPIEPNQRIELMRNDQHYLRDRDGITKRSGATDFKNVLIGSTVVKFEDGTVWTSYKLPLASSNITSN